MSYLAAFMATLSGTSSIPFSSAMLQAGALQLPVAFEQLAGTTDFTFEFWATLNGTSGQLYVTSPDTGDARFMAHLPYNGNFYFASGYIGDGSGQTPPIPPPAGFQYNQLHHWALRVRVPGSTAGSTQVLLDGQLIYDYYTSAVRHPFGAPIIFPAQQGLAGEVRYWNYCRSDAQILGLLSRAVTGPQPGLVGAWRCDERGPAGTQVRDRSGNNLHGTTY